MEATQALQDFEDGPIPHYYAKVIDVGPKGEISGVEVMPTHVAIHRLGIEPEDYQMIHARAIIVNHPHGITIISLGDHDATSNEYSPKGKRLTLTELVEL